jgi:hypothetical protein
LKAELHSASVSSELKRVMHPAIGVEALVAVPGENIHYATAPMPEGARPPPLSWLPPLCWPRPAAMLALALLAAKGVL